MLLSIFLRLKVALDLDQFGFGTDSRVNNQCEFFLVFVLNDIDVLPGNVLDFLPFLFVFGKQFIDLNLQLFPLLVLLLLL